MGIYIYMSNLENPRFTERTSIHTFSNTLGTNVFFCGSTPESWHEVPRFPTSTIFPAEIRNFYSFSKAFPAEIPIFYNFSRFQLQFYSFFSWNPRFYRWHLLKLRPLRTRLVRQRRRWRCCHRLELPQLQGAPVAGENHCQKWKKTWLWWWWIGIFNHVLMDIRIILSNMVMNRDSIGIVYIYMIQVDSWWFTQDSWTKGRDLMMFLWWFMSVWRWWIGIFWD